MDNERLRWITKKPTLDAFEVKVTLADTPTGTIATLWAGGTCNRRRGYLWTHNETVAVEAGRYSLHDLVNHIALVATQDRPVTNQELTRGLCGAAWEQPELPF